MKKYKILMTLMGLNIGGAETHVLELSKELNKKGYEIIVASNGGVYEKELTDIGIRHFNVPLNRRSLHTMAKSYFLLKEIIKNEKPNIVHCHARIPGFICGLLHKKLKNFTFVTSAHWVFDTGGALKYLTNWGQKVIAVSEDIKQYLSDNYRVPLRDVFITINGIDTDKFSPDIKGELVKKEFKLDNSPTIVYVSRMDEDRALAAKLLISIAPKIKEKISNIKIIIVGGGNVFEPLKVKADEINSRFGENLISMTGPRTDINELVAVGDIFIGVSRAALEAMAAAKPVILAGNEGYMGIFAKETLPGAIKTNFCCRDYPKSSEEALLKDILKLLLDTSKEERSVLGEYGRQVIFDYYSVSRMADDCIVAYDAAYRQSHTPPHNIVMSGYYGFNNSGDEAILLAMYKSISCLTDNINITVLSNSPKETRQKYGIPVVSRFSIPAVLKALGKSEILLSGGGSLLQDTTSTRSLIYYLSIIAIAKLMGKKVMLYANGIGPVSKKANRRMVRRVVNKADLITLREENSLEELVAMGVHREKAHVTADPVFTMEGIPKDLAGEVLEKAGIPLDKPIVGVSVRRWYQTEEFAQKLASLCDDICKEKDRTILFIVMQFPQDIIMSETVRQKMKCPSYILNTQYSPYELMGIIGLMDFILSMRLHTLIFAAKQRIPLLGFVYDPKIEYYLDKLKMPSGGRLTEFDEKKSLLQVEDIIENREKYVELLDKATRLLEKKAPDNDKFLMSLLKG